MYEIVYFNWSGTKEGMQAELNIVEKIANKYSVELVGVFIPSNEWKHAALYKSKDFDSFLKFQKEIRRELHKAEITHKERESPRKLELLVDIDTLY